MLTLTTTRDTFIPKGARKVADKLSDAVAYLYTNGRGLPGAVLFAGKAMKPTKHFYFRDEARREKCVREFFDGRRARLAAKTARKAEARKPSKLQLGHVLVNSWGYEQTNIDWYQVTRVISPTMVEIRPIASNTIEETAWAQGNCVPRVDAFTGEPMRKRVVDGDSVKIESYAWARLWDGRPRAWTAYH